MSRDMAPGELLLETDTGEPVRVRGGGLAKLLAVAGERLKLVYVSACWSAAVAGAEQRRLLGLAPAAHDPDRADADVGQSQPIGTPATDLVTKLDCTVVATRYAIADDFAIGLACRMYSLPPRDGRSLPSALGTALGSVIPGHATAACPPLSVATLTLIGARAADLQLAAPAGPAQSPSSPREKEPAGFPAPPDRFVGRVAVMAKASAALAPRNGPSGVRLHGMPGDGKSACARRGICG